LPLKSGSGLSAARTGAVSNREKSRTNRCMT
jgi:hypothetical protein